MQRLETGEKLTAVLGSYVLCCCHIMTVLKLVLMRTDKNPAEIQFICPSNQPVGYFA